MSLEWVSVHRPWDSRRALDAAVAYAKERLQFGKAIADFQGIQFMLADMAISVEAARQLVYRAAAVSERGEPSATYLGAAAKCFCVGRRDECHDGRRAGLRWLRVCQDYPPNASCVMPRSPRSVRRHQPDSAGCDRPFASSSVDSCVSVTATLGDWRSGGPSPNEVPQRSRCACGWSWREVGLSIPKQLIKIAGRPIVEHTIALLDGTT